MRMPKRATLTEQCTSAQVLLDPPRRASCVHLYVCFMQDLAEGQVGQVQVTVEAGVLDYAYDSRPSLPTMNLHQLQASVV